MSCSCEALRPEGAVPDAGEDEPAEEDHDPVSQDRPSTQHLPYLDLASASCDFWEELMTQIMATPPSKPHELLTPPRLPCYSRRGPKFAGDPARSVFNMQTGRVEEILFTLNKNLGFLRIPMDFPSSHNSKSVK